MFRPLKATFIGLAGFALVAAPSTLASASGDPGHDHPPEKVGVTLPASGEQHIDFGKGREMRRALRWTRQISGTRTETAQPVTTGDIPGLLDMFVQDGDCDMIAGDFRVGAAMEAILDDHPDQ